MSKADESAAEQQQPIRTCKFYGPNFRRPRVYPSRTILIDPPEAAFLDDHNKSKHGAAQWTVNGLGSKRLRLHGKVEGNLSRLRNDKDDLIIPHDNQNVAPSSSKFDPIRPSTRRHAHSDFKPLVGSKRSRYASLIDEEEEEEEEEEEQG